MSDSPFYCNACSVHLEKTTDKNLVEKETKLYKKTHQSLVRATETLKTLVLAQIRDGIFSTP